jgi:DNA polymerase-3 subunit epsilon
VYSYLTVPSARGSARRTPPTTPTFAGSGGIDLQDVTGAGVAELLPAESSELVEGLNAAAKRHRLWPWALALVIVLTFALSPLTLIAGVPALIAAVWRDRVRRTLVTFYELDGPPAAGYASLIDDFSTITTVKKGWHTVAKGALRTTHQRKVNAGASTVVRREALTRSLAGPPHLASNIAIPTFQSSSRSMYILPDRALVRDGSRYADIGYDELRAIAGPFRFIEDGRVPSDATVVDTTWKYVNKKGGPDKRFKNNRRLPVVLYGEVVLSTRSGMSTVLSFSRPDAATVLASAVSRMHAPAPIVPTQRPALSSVVQAPPAPVPRACELPANLPDPTGSIAPLGPDGSVTAPAEQAWTPPACQRTSNSSRSPRTVVCKWSASLTTNPHWPMPPEAGSLTTRSIPTSRHA